MATNVDERIVAAKFDASDFEKGVDKTIKKLDELKTELNLKETGKNIEELAKKTESSTESMGKSLDKLTERFTTFVGMVKQKILSGLADEVANVFLKMEQSVKNFIKGISSDQVSAGMSKYEQMLASVRTMMSAGETQNSAYDAIGKLQEYSDQTSYSLSQMTDALSKLRAAGVDLNTAQKSVEGIANACANAGINATDAQRAFYNLSQAYSSGVLKYTDYRSLEMLNMTTEQFKEELLEAAVSAKTLKKNADGTYTTINKFNKKVTAGKKVTKQNIQDMLRYNFVTSDVMNELFGGTFFFDESKFKEYKKKYATLDEAIAAAKKDYGETAVNAYLAAREARSFTDVINTLKDVVSTGWSTTFEHLFGKLEEAKDFFTQLAEGELADVVYKIGEYRNAILGFWNDGVGDTGGGAVFRQTILNVADALGTLLKTFLQVLPGFDELNNEEEEGTPILENLGDKMFILSMKIRDFSERVKEAAQNFNKFMNDKVFDDGNGGKMSRIEKLREIFAHLSSVLGIFARVAIIAFSAISRAFYTLSPIFDGFLSLLSKITEPLVALRNNTKVFKDIEHSIDNIFTVLEPVAKVLGEIIGFLGEVATFFVNMAIDTVTSNISFFSDVLGLFIELLTGNSAQMKDSEGVLAGIRKDFEGIKDACKSGLSAVTDFFGALLGDIKKLLGLEKEATEGQDDQNGGVFSGLINFFNTNQFIQDAKKWVDQAIIDVGNFVKSIPERVMQFGANIYDTLRNLFFTEKTEYNGSQLETNTILTPLGEWVTKAIEDIKAFFKSLPQRILDGVGKIGSWIDEVFDAWFNGNKANTGAKASKDDKNKVVNKDSAIMQRFESFIEETKKAVAAWFEDLPNKIQNAFQTVGDFATNLFKALNEFLFGKKVTKTIKEIDPLTGKTSFRKITVTYKKGFSKWLDGAIKDIKKFIQKIPEYVKAGIKGAGDIISTVIGALFGRPDDKEVTNKDVEDRIKKPFLGIDLTSVLDTIKDIGTTLLNQIARIFTGTDDVEANSEWFSNVVAQGIEWIRSKAETALHGVLDFLKDLPTKIANFFKGEDETNANRGPIGQAILNFGQTIGKFIVEDLPAKVLEFIDGAVDLFGIVWDKLYNAIVGEADESSKEAAEDAQKAAEIDAISGAQPKVNAWQKFVSKLGETISHIWEELPVWIANGIELAVAAINEIVSNVGDWLKDIGVQKEVEKTAETVTSEATEGMAKSAEDGEGKEEPKLVTAIKNIGERIKTLFVETIPKFIQDAWAAISKLGSEVFEGISSIFTGETPKSEVGNAVKDFGQMIYDFITKDIPAYIRKAFDFIGKLINGDKDAWKKNIQGGDDVYKQVVAAVEDQQRQANERLEKDTKKSGFWSFADGLKESFLKAFQSIGPAILNGIAAALNWIGDIATIIVDALTGKKSISDQVDEVYGEQKPELREALKNIGESIKNFFLDTIPKFIGSAIGTLAKEAPEWFKKLFGAMNAAAEEESKEAIEGGGAAQSFGDAVTNATGVLDIVKNIFNELKSWVGENKDFLEIIAVIVALTMLFSKLRDLFGLSDEFEEASNAIKWTAITIAITAIAGIMSYITQLVDSGDTEKINKFESILDKIGDLMEKIAWIVGLLSVGKLFNALGNKWEGSDGKVSIGEKLLGGLSDALTGFFKTIGISAGTYVSGGLISATIDTTLSTISDSFATLSSGVDDALKLIAPFVDQLANMDSKLNTAINAVTKIKDLFAVFMQVFGELYTEATGVSIEETNASNAMARYAAKDSSGKVLGAGPVKEKLSMSLFMTELQQRLDLFLQLSQFIDQIANALHKFDQIDDAERTINDLKAVLINDNFKGFLTDLMNVLKMAVEASEIAPEKFGSTQYMVMRQSGMALALDMLASALSIFANGISGLTTENVDAFRETLGVFSSLYEAIGDAKVEENSLFKAFLGDNSLSKIGGELKMFALQMKSFYEYIKDIPGFKEDETEETNRKVKSIIGIAAEMGKIMTEMLAGYGSTSSLLTSLSEGLPGFGDAVAQFFVKLNTAFESSNGKGLTPERVSMLVSATEGMANMLHSINELTNMLRSNSAEDLSSVLDKIFGGLESSGNVTNVDRIASLIATFDKALIKIMETEDFAESYKTIGANIAQKMFEGIQAAFDEDPNLRIQITPVLKLDDAIKEQLRQQMADAGLTLDTAPLAQNAQNANAQTESKSKTLDDIYETIGEVTAAVDSLKESQATVDQITSAFAKLNMYINKNVLVGEIAPDIDAKIGEYIALLNLGVTTPG